MDTLHQVATFLRSWSDGGESHCRELLVSHHCEPSTTASADALATIYHSLITSVLHSWSRPTSLNPATFAVFVQSVLAGLPSSSATTASKSVDALALGELLIDLIWSIDCELDETGADAIPENKDGTEARESALKDKSILAEVLTHLLTVNIVDITSCRERLDLSIQAVVGLISDQHTAEKKIVRTRTAIFYKQTKFNLLREQSEGYSKLSIEIAGSLGPPHSSQTGLSAEPQDELETRAKEAWQRVVSIIGYFDLDPNRALDIVLDVFSANIYTVSYEGKNLDEILTIFEGPSVPTFRGSKVIAQVLGFKFGYYDATGTDEVPSDGLFLLTALLIRHNFLTLEDIYPHLTPNDDGMEDIHKAYLHKVDERIAGAKNSLLAMAAPLESAAKARSGTSAPDQSKPAPEKEIAPPKIRLLVALLAVGALRPAFSILNSFPWIVDANPEVADLLIRVLKETILPLYGAAFTVNKGVNLAQPRGKPGTAGVFKVASRRTQLTLTAPTPPPTAATEFVFFYPQWKDYLPVCGRLDDIMDITEPMMRFVGLHVARDIVFLTKLLRLGRSHIAAGNPPEMETRAQPSNGGFENPIRAFWFRMIRRYMVPSLPLVRGNAVFAVEIWNMLRTYDHSFRWRLYGEWKTALYKSHPELRIRHVQADRESKGILRRLSHNTLEALSGPMAKLAHSNPCILFANAVNQVMAYDNLAEVVVLALRYVTSFGFDVLVYIILDALSNPNKKRVKDDGVNTSDWLQSLASFTGMLYRRYNTDLTPILTYITHQLHNRETTEVVVLRELIWKMAGIEPLPSLSDVQIMAMSGGPVLRVEAIASHSRGARMDPNDLGVKGGVRLGKALLEASLALPLLIQVAQQRQACAYRTQDVHLKSVAGLFDTMHGVFLQYLELLSSPGVVSAEDYASKVVPSLAELGDLYGLSAPICMQITRPRLHAEIMRAAKAAAAEAQAKAAEAKEQQVDPEQREKNLKATIQAQRQASAKGGSAAAAETCSTVGEATTETNGKNEAQSLTEPMKDAVTVKTTHVSEDCPWLPELSKLFDEVKRIAPKNALDVIGPAFYLTFWQMSTYDLGVPQDRYIEEGATLRSLSSAEDKKMREADRSSNRALRQTAVGHRQRRDRFNQFAASLAQDWDEHRVAQQFTLRRLQRERDQWFPNHPSMKEASSLIQAIIDHCLQPRCLLSPMDADYCAQLIKMMHKTGTSGFATIMCYDKLLGEHVKVVVFSCSEYEARNYGRFLHGILTDLWKWHQDEKLWTQDNRIKSGNKYAFLPGFQRKWPVKTPESVPSFGDFKQLLKKLHRKLGKALIDCVEAGDFMHVYNAIIVLKEILPVFPMAAVAEFIGSQLDTAVQRFVETEERGDLKILGRAYAASLKKRESLWAIPKDLVAKTAPAAVKAGSMPSQVERPRQPPDSGKASNNNAAITLQTSAPGTPTRTTSTSASIPAVKETTPTSTKLTLENIPRPEVIKRVRDAKTTPAARDDSTSSDVVMSDASKPASNLDGPRTVDHLRPSKASVSRASSVNGASSRPESPVPASALTHTKKDITWDPTRSSSPNAPKGSSSGDPSTADSQQAMRPPVIPSQTSSAQELRETAKLAQNGDTYVSRALQRAGGEGSTPSSSPRPHRRSTSADSRGSSSGRARSDRGGAEAERPEERHSDRRRPRADRDRPPRDRPPRDEDDNVEDKDRDRARDRHTDRDLRDHRDRDRDRDRERDRDRHRREEKDRERDSRKDRELPPRAPPSAANHEPLADRNTPGHTDTGRHRGNPNDEDILGKRRRPVDDEPDRSSKRGSRRDGSHRDEKSRRASERDGRDRPRDTDRRRKDRETVESDSRNAAERTNDKTRGSEEPSKHPSTSTAPPSAPRAMTSPRSSKFPELPRDRSDRERERGGREREQHRGDREVTAPSTGPGVVPSESRGGGGTSGGSLRSRISSDKELPLTRNSYGGGQSSVGNGGRRTDPSSNNAGGRTWEDNDDRDGPRKRTASERDKESGAAAHRNSVDSTSQPPKRPRLNRDRYGESQSRNGGGGPTGERQSRRD